MLFVKRNLLVLLILFFLFIVLGVWVLISVCVKELDLIFKVTLFQSIQLFVTALIGCCITHVISAAYSKREKRIIVCIDSINKMCEMTKCSKPLLQSYVINTTDQKNAELSQAVLGFFSNLSSELSLLKDTLDNDKALTSKKLVKDVEALAVYLRTTKDIIAETALCNGNGAKKISKSNHEMILAANQFFDQYPTRLRGLKVGLLQ